MTVVVRTLSERVFEVVRKRIVTEGRDGSHIGATLIDLREQSASVRRR